MTVRVKMGNLDAPDDSVAGGGAGGEGGGGDGG